MNIHGMRTGLRHAESVLLLSKKVDDQPAESEEDNGSSPKDPFVLFCSLP